MEQFLLVLDEIKVIAHEKAVQFISDRDAAGFLNRL